MPDMQKHVFTFRDMNDAHSLSLTLAHYFPRPEQFAPGIYELLLNAVEHGNLGISLDEKSDLLRRNLWHEEIKRRQASPEFSSRQVEVVLEKDPEQCVLTIADQGKGFPWRDYIGRLVEGKRPNGRGLWIALNSKFDRVMFNQAGNKVTCIARYGHWSTRDKPEQP
ncbi:MAG: ATP-binding protein [Alphaproteobacteria bacterium]|nr:ATP-binding protein [Alphaproteobacteria bacterium]